MIDDRGVAAVLDWYREHGRELPWRGPERTGWGVLVCEVMSQQTPVARIVEPWTAWLARWPTPADLAADSVGEAVRMWGRLGYPRRAVRLHAAAVAIVERHGGEVPDDEAALLALPGIGAYTAAATVGFAYGRRSRVLDVNVRRVLSRVSGDERPPTGAPTRAEIDRATAVLPIDPATATRWNSAVMELGALVCTARNPRCGQCPLESVCPGPPARSATTASPAQPWLGSDRQVRGLVMARLRAAPGVVARDQLDLVWSDRVQIERCIVALVADGLAVVRPDGVTLPR